jgi:hypothetical protein
MPTMLHDYQPVDRAQVLVLYGRFLRHLVALDPLHQLRHTPQHEAVILDKDVQDVREHRGKFIVAVDGTAIVGFVVGVIQERSDQPDVHDFTAGRITELFVDEAMRG